MIKNKKVIVAIVVVVLIIIILLVYYLFISLRIKNGFIITGNGKVGDYKYDIFVPMTTPKEKNNGWCVLKDIGYEETIFDDNSVKYTITQCTNRCTYEDNPTIRVTRIKKNGNAIEISISNIKNESIPKKAEVSCYPKVYIMFNKKPQKVIFKDHNGQEIGPKGYKNTK